MEAGDWVSVMWCTPSYGDVYGAAVFTKIQAVLELFRFEHFLFDSISKCLTSKWILNDI